MQLKWLPGQESFVRWRKTQPLLRQPYVIMGTDYAPLLANLS